MHPTPGLRRQLLGVILGPLPSLQDKQPGVTLEPERDLGINLFPPPAAPPAFFLTSVYGGMREREGETEREGDREVGREKREMERVGREK